jgi:hypothetical protein
MITSQISNRISNDVTSKYGEHEEAGYCKQPGRARETHRIIS